MKNACCGPIRNAQTSPSFESRVKKPVGSFLNDLKCPPMRSVGSWGGSVIFETGFIVGKQK
jgi:hypothetical protein